MLAWGIERDRHGEPATAFQQREITVPHPGPDEVLVLVMAVGINYNGIWAARGEPVSPFTWHRENFHVPGSEASGIVWQVGAAIRSWRPGDEVVVHCAVSCGECPDCNGRDPLACRSLKVLGYETPRGTFAQFVRVRASQLLRKPKNLTWEEAAAIGIGSVAYRMLVTQAQLSPHDRVLVWGAAGGLGSAAVQLTRLVGAACVGVVSTEERGAYCRTLGASHVLLRTRYHCWDGAVPTDPAEARRYQREMLRFDRDLRACFNGDRPTIIVEHPGRDTFPVSVFVGETFGKIVTCGATTGYQVTFDLRHLWMRQKQILGSHQANLAEAVASAQLFATGQLRSQVNDVFDFNDLPRAHERLREPEMLGKVAVRIQAAAGG
jgi:crotonyl-CoA carboxylase/reductase